LTAVNGKHRGESKKAFKLLMTHERAPIERGGPEGGGGVVV